MPIINIEDLSGGLTDFKLSAQPNQYEIAENLLITRDKGLEQRYGSTFYNSSAAQLPVGQQRIGRFFIFKDTLFVVSGNKIYYLVGNTWTELKGFGNNSAFVNTTTGDYVCESVWNNICTLTASNFELPIDIYQDASSNFKLQTAGLPKLSSNPTITPSNNDSKNYLYSFIMERTYTINDRVFVDQSAITTVEVNSAADMAIGGHKNVISAIPVLANGVLTNYDTSNIKISIYRTEHNGVVSYYVGQVTNGTTTYDDTLTDALLVDNALLYIEGGIVENDAPPKAKYIAQCNNFTYYANVMDGSQIVPYRVLQSIQDDPESVPATFFIDFPSEVTAIGVVKNIPVIFTKDKKIHRLEGSFDELGQGFLSFTTFANDVGCVGQNSIVTTPDGLFFLGLDSPYWTDGYNIKRLSVREGQGFTLQNTYKTLVNTETKRLNTYGTYDKANQRIYWSMQEGQVDNDVVYVFDETYDAFTKLTGGDSFAPTAIIFENNILVRGDSRGYIFKHLDSLYDDIIVDTEVDTSLWETNVVDYKFKHISFDFGNTQAIKWVTKVTVQGKPTTELDIDVKTYDDEKSPVDLKAIGFASGLEWGSKNWVWNNAEDVWSLAFFMSKTRRMPSTRLRSRRKQLYMENARSIIAWSDNYTTTAIDATTKQITLDGSGYRWYANPENYYIRFSDDLYVKEFKILNRVSDTVLLVEDTANLLTNAASGIKWEIIGYPKEQRLNISKIIYDFEMMNNDKIGQYQRDREKKGNA